MGSGFQSRRWFFFFIIQREGALMYFQSIIHANIYTSFEVKHFENHFLTPIGQGAIILQILTPLQIKVSSGKLEMAWQL